MDPRHTCPAVRPSRTVQRAQAIKGRARGGGVNVQGVTNKASPRNSSMCIKVVLGLHQQAQAGLQSVAIWDCTDNKLNYAVEQSVNSKELVL